LGWSRRGSNPDDDRHEAKSWGIIDDQKMPITDDPVSSSVISGASGQSGGHSEVHEVPHGRGSLGASPTAETAPDPIAVALASAIADAAKAGRWDIVAQLAKELEGRRLQENRTVARGTRERIGHD
jgi:hypothetical protein